MNISMSFSIWDFSCFAIVSTTLSSQLAMYPFYRVPVWWPDVNKSTNATITLVSFKGFPCEPLACMAGKPPSAFEPVCRSVILVSYFPWHPIGTHSSSQTRVGATCTRMRNTDDTITHKLHKWTSLHFTNTIVQVSSSWGHVLGVVRFFEVKLSSNKYTAATNVGVWSLSWHSGPSLILSLSPNIRLSRSPLGSRVPASTWASPSGLVSQRSLDTLPPGAAL